MTDQKHSWTEQELWVVCVCYKEHLPVELALRLTNTTNETSMKMRYQNCLFLDKGKVDNSLSHASKKHVEVWKNVEEIYKSRKPLLERKLEMVDDNNLFVETILLISMLTCFILITYALFLI